MRVCAYNSPDPSLLTKYRELDEASDKELEIWSDWIARHLLLKDHSLHKAKVPFLMSQLKFFLHREEKISWLELGTNGTSPSQDRKL